MCISFWQMSMQPWFQCYCKWAPNFVRTSNTTGRVIGAFDLAIVLLIWKCATAALGLNWHCTQGANYHKVGVFIGFSIPVNSAYSLVERVCRWEFFCCYILLVCYWNVLVAYLLICTWHDSSFICFIWPRRDTKILCGTYTVWLNLPSLPFSRLEVHIVPHRVFTVEFIISFQWSSGCCQLPLNYNIYPCLYQWNTGSPTLSQLLSF